jgi:glycosyltransferase involved in cell wall biosynthesis
MSQPEVSVVIPVRDRPEELVRVLEAIARQDYPREQFEVLVCDDGSTADIRMVVEDARRSDLEVSYFRQPPRGPATARNLGIRNARGSIVAMTDSDTKPDGNWLSSLVRALNTHPEAAGVEGKVISGNEGQFDPIGEAPTNTEGGVFLTCNCAYRRSALDRVGGFDETFPFPAYEDADLAARIGEIGSIVWQPEAVVIHPQRPLTLSGIWKKLHHWEYVLLMGLRYGYLGWKKYPTKHPRIRVAVLSTIALPLSKFRTALRWLAKRPARSLKLAAFGVFEAVGALFVVVPRALFGNFRRRKVRGSFLDLEPLHIEEIRLRR